MTRMELPEIGFGTYRAEGDACRQAVETALDLGYRHVDTAEMYGNQIEVGEGIRNAAVDRDELLIATKLSPDHLAYQDVIDRAEVGRDRLGLDVIDLLYIHWPTRTYDPADTLRALDELHERGVIRQVGLSNFTAELLHEAIERLDAPVFAHQVECHPFLPQDELRRIAVEQDHQLVAYSPIARGAVTDDPTLRAIADDQELTPPQLALAWLRSKEAVVPIPKSTTDAHIRENFEATTVTLDAETVEAIDEIDRRERVVDFPSAPWNE